MNGVFHVKDDSPNVYIGLHIWYDHTNHTLSIDQQLYVDRQVAKYGFSDAKMVNIPADPNLILSWNMDPNSDKTELFPFEEALGSMNFAQTCTKPNISYVLSVATQFAQNPKPTHCTAMKKIFGCVKGTNTLGLYYSKTPNLHQSITYCDADFAANPTDNKSRTGYVLFVNGGPVIWSSQKQSITATSTTETEYVAA